MHDEGRKEPALSPTAWHDTRTLKGRREIGAKTAGHAYRREARVISPASAYGNEAPLHDDDSRQKHLHLISFLNNPAYGFSKIPVSKPQSDTSREFQRFTTFDQEFARGVSFSL